MTYWIYENRVIKSTRIHEGSCGFCNNGQGRRSATSSSQSIWHGPFESQQSAELFGLNLAIQPLQHSCCEPREPATKIVKEKARPYKIFSNPEVDEATLTLTELFDRRMRQIYTSMRDDLNYKPTRFLNSVKRHGGVEHAKRSLRRNATAQEGLQKLKDLGRAWQTMEAHIIDPQFQSLFTSWEIQEARRRLTESQ